MQLVESPSISLSARYVRESEKTIWELHKSTNIYKACLNIIALHVAVTSGKPHEKRRKQNEKMKNKTGNTSCHITKTTQPNERENDIDHKFSSYLATRLKCENDLAGRLFIFSWPGVKYTKS